ncbi:MAG TPA: hypothetical protein VK168_17350 [Saprospiraceae bacterium]|nr:hypothetical protein [Saprospiraceae bacterium]
MQWKSKKDKSATEQLEAWASDELNLLDFAGVQTFRTEDLVRLLTQTELRITQFERRQKQAIYIGAASVLWAPLSYIAVLLGQEWLGGVLMRLFPITVLAVLVWSFWIRYKLGSLGGFYAQRDIIREELKNRRSA